MPIMTVCRAARIAVTACWICALSCSLRVSRSVSIWRIKFRTCLICSSGGAGWGLAASWKADSGVQAFPVGQQLLEYAVRTPPAGTLTLSDPDAAEERG